MDSTGTIIAVVIGSTALFLGFMLWKLVWFLRKAGELSPGTSYDAATERATKDCATGAPDADGGGDA